MASLTPKENFMRVLRGEEPEFIPSYYEPYLDMAADNMLTPIVAPNGPVYSPWGVKYVGNKETNYGALPEPGNFILDDITKWRDVIKNPDMSDFDWEKHFQNPKILERADRSQRALAAGGGDYFQTLVSFMGFEGALMAMFEEPEEVYALFDYLSEYFMAVVKNTIYYTKPDIYFLADDSAAWAAPFVSLDMYKTLLKPFYKRHYDLALENNMLIQHHNCGKCEIFIPDWLEMGVNAWDPAQTSNDLVGIKQKYGDRLTIVGGWDNTGRISSLETSDDELLEALYKYVDTFAPGGHFVFSAHVQGDKDDPVNIRKTELIKKFYFDYVKDWYKNH